VLGRGDEVGTDVTFPNPPRQEDEKKFLCPSSTTSSVTGGVTVTMHVFLSYITV
jgi:hypothetical protein